MPRRSSLSYGDAIRLLAPGSARINQADRAATAGIVGAGALTHGATLALLGPKNALIQLVREVTGNPAARIRATGGRSYYELQEASHTVLALSAFFDAFRAEVPGFDGLALTDAEKLATAAHSGRRRSLPQELEGSSFPLPGPTQGLGDTRRDVANAYAALHDATITFCEGLAAWPRVRPPLDPALLRTRVVARGMRMYEDRFDRLATDLPEFGFRTLRHALEHSLADGREHTALLAGRLDALESLSRNLIELFGSAPADPRGPLGDVLDGLANSMTAVFRQPLLRIKDIDFRLRLPAVESGFISPDFRMAECRRDSAPERERWWHDQPRSTDLVSFLTGYLTDPASPHRPLLILGQPGAGKTLLTKVIAARLPTGRFTTIVVPLRRATGGASPVEQIESAIEQIMDEHIRWAQLRRAARSTTVVVIFDGFDELVQATGTAHSQYIDRIAEFQESQWDLGFPVITIVTSRMLVMDRATVPAGTVLIRLEDLTDEQITTWVEAVNRANAGREGYGQLSAPELIAHGDLVRQPLLLTLLAVYYDEQRAGDRRPEAGISRADLFTGLLTAFIRRQVAGKAPRDLLPREREARERRLRRDLAITAFAMVNRNRDVVSRADLRADLESFAAAAGDDSRHTSGDVLGPEQLVTAAFFVVFGPDDLQGEDSRRTYEFLHATFGDFLIAEYVVGSLRELTDLRRRMDSGPGFGAQLNTGQLRALLSHQPLVKREAVVGFLTDLCDRSRDDRAAVVDTIAGLLAEARHPGSLAGVKGYRPCRYDPVRLLAAYTANLVCLAALVSGTGVAYDRLMDDETWVSTVRLWRAGLDEKGQLAMLGRLRRESSGLITAAPGDSGWDVASIAAEEARLVGDLTAYGHLRAGAATWREQEPDSFDSGRFHAEVVSLATRRWPVPSLRRLTLYDESRYGDLLRRATDRPESMSSTSATMVLECLTEDGAQLPRDIVSGLTRVALRRLPTSVTAPPELIIACPYLIDDFPELLEQVGAPEEHAVLHALILRRGLARLPAAYVPRVRDVLADLQARLPELPLDRGVVSAEMVEQFAAAQVGHRTALFLLMELSEFGELAWRQIAPRTMADLLAHPLAEEFLDEARLCHLLVAYLRAHDRRPATVTLRAALDDLHDLVATAGDAA